ncbi:hypothetical protein HY639_01480 [Candidatus Woesearchaeota archaeon]|nr:hypothetical protein [Candidatus Woesearchaeota archaeon]
MAIDDKVESALVPQQDALPKQSAARLVDRVLVGTMTSYMMYLFAANAGLFSAHLDELMRLQPEERKACKENGFWWEGGYYTGWLIGQMATISTEIFLISSLGSLYIPTKPASNGAYYFYHRKKKRERP